MALRALLLDLEGVLYQEGEAIVGAEAAVAAMQSRSIPIRFVTNTTTSSRARIVAGLKRMGFAVSDAEVFSPALAAGRLLAAEGLTRVHLAALPALGEEFSEFELVEEAPEAVVLGDLYKGFCWDRLDGLFRMLIGGARLIALHRNRYCRREGRLSLDLGPFVAALEYAAGVEATVVGKPSEAFFASAVADLGLDRSEVLMVGDDIESDIGGAKAAGLAALQVRTGKYSARDETLSDVARLASVAELPDWIARQG